jgi:hypothetical protein
MLTSQCRNLNMKNQSSVSSPKPHNTTTEPRENEMAEISDREFKSLQLKMNNVLKEDSNK